MSQPKKKTNFVINKGSPGIPKDPIDRLCLHIKQRPIAEKLNSTDAKAMAIAYSALPDMVKAIRMLKQALEEAMPGVKHIACQDYEILNTAPCFANDVLFQIRKAWTEEVKK